MRLAKASALINTTWQRLIRVAWVPSNQPIVSKPPSLAPAFPQSWSDWLLVIFLQTIKNASSLSSKCPKSNCLLVWTTLKDYVVVLYSSLYLFNTLSPLIIGEQARVTAACTAAFPGKKEKQESHLNDRHWPVSLIPKKFVVVLKPDGLFRSDNVIASEKWTMCFKNFTWSCNVNIKHVSFNNKNNEEVQSWRST